MGQVELALAGKTAVVTLQSSCHLSMCVQANAQVAPGLQGYCSSSFSTHTVCPRKLPSHSLCARSLAQEGCGVQARRGR